MGHWGSLDKERLSREQGTAKGHAVQTRRDRRRSSCAAGSAGQSMAPAPCDCFLFPWEPVEPCARPPGHGCSRAQALAVVLVGAMGAGLQPTISSRPTGTAPLAQTQFKLPSWDP